MKLIFASSCLIIGIFAQATSLYYGPYLFKSVGKNSCSIKPTAVTWIINGVKTTSLIKPEISGLREKIVTATKSPLRVFGIHTRKTDPAIVISAGVSPSLPTFELYVDSSNIKRREGKVSQELINLVNRYCDKIGR